MLRKVAIQGISGSFHEIAANGFFGNKCIDIISCESFGSLFKAVSDCEADYGVVAIENSVAGTILPNYSLLLETDVRVIGEIFVRVKQNLLAIEGQSISDIKEVYSHPIAINQCQNFFESYPHIKLVESIDTALSAKDISDKKLLGAGAIASVGAAQMYGLEVLHEGIETNKKNFTRFLVIEKQDGKKQSVNPVEQSLKTSLCFDLPHKTGSLASVLSIFAFYEVSLTKIQSIPIVGKEWEYMFFVDLVSESFERYTQSINAIKPLINQLKILGEYEKGKRIMANH